MRLSSTLKILESIILLLIVSSIIVVAVNDPGHDTLYIEQQGDSSLNGTLNITQNLSVIRAIRLSNMTLYGQGDTTSTTYLSADGSGNLFIDAQGAVRIKWNIPGDVVYIGQSTSTPTDLNISGDLYVRGDSITVAGVNVCLFNGSNCPSSLGGANITGNAATAGYIPQFQSASILNNSIISQTATGIGIGTASPTAKLDVNGSINISSTTGTLYVNGTRAAGIGTCTGNDVIQNISEKGVTCITPTGTTYTADNYTLTLTGTQFTLNTTYTNATYPRLSFTNCSTNEAITGSSATGWKCSGIANTTATTYTADNYTINLTGTTFRINETWTNATYPRLSFTNCSTNEAITGSSATGWKCSGIANTTATTYTADNYTLTLTGTQFTLNTTYTNNTYVVRNNWSTIDNYPAACAAGTAITAINDTITCSGVNASSGGITASSPTAGYIPQFQNTTGLNNSIISQSGNTLTINGNISMPINFYIGNGAAATGTQATAIGYLAQATGSYTTAIGNTANASTYGSTAMGLESTAGNSDSGNDSATAVGRDAKATGNWATALGYATDATGESSTTLGKGSQATGESSLAIGNEANATQYASIAIGLIPDATGAYSTAIGYQAQATAGYAVAIGSQASATAQDAFAFGRGVVNNVANTSKFGGGVTVNGNISQNDNYYHCFGDSCDAYMYYNGTSLVIKVT